MQVSPRISPPTSSFQGLVDRAWSVLRSDTAAIGIATGRPVLQVDAAATQPSAGTSVIATTSLDGSMTFPRWFEALAETARSDRRASNLVVPVLVHELAHLTGMTSNAQFDEGVAELYARAPGQMARYADAMQVLRPVTPVQAYEDAVAATATTLFGDADARPAGQAVLRAAVDAATISALRVQLDALSTTPKPPPSDPTPHHQHAH